MIPRICQVVQQPPRSQSEVTAHVRLPAVSRLGVRSRHERTQEALLAVDRGPVDLSAGAVRTFLGSCGTPGNQDGRARMAGRAGKGDLLAVGLAAVPHSKAGEP